MAVALRDAPPYRTPPAYRQKPQSASGRVSAAATESARTYVLAPAQRVRACAKAQSHPLCPPRGARAGAIIPAAQLLPAMGHGAGFLFHPLTTMLCWRLGAGCQQGISSAAKAGWDGCSPGGLRKPSAGRSGGSRAHTAKSKKREAASLIPAGSFPGLGGCQFQAPHLPLSFAHMCWGPKRTTAGLGRDGKGKGLDSPVPRKGQGGPLRAALCLAHSLQAAWVKEGGSCQQGRVGDMSPARATKGQRPPCTARVSTWPQQWVCGGTVARRVKLAVQGGSCGEQWAQGQSSGGPGTVGQ